MAGPYQNSEESTKHSTDPDSSGIVRILRKKVGDIGVVVVGVLSLTCVLIFAAWGFAVFTPLPESIAGNGLLLVVCAVVLLGLSVVIPRLW